MTDSRSSASASEHVYLDAPAATPERIAAWRRWVDDYAIACSLHWVETGQADEDVALDATAAVVADLSRLDQIEWMPLGQAQLVRMQESLGGHELEGDARVQYMNALRTSLTSTHRERVHVLAHHLGVDFAHAKQMATAVEASAGRESDDGGATSLYRYYDFAGVLLYVGITKDPAMRDAQHAKSSPWHALTSRRSVEWFDGRAEADAAERNAIRDEAPLFNTMHSTTETRRRAMEYLVTRVSAAEAVAS